MKTIISDKKTGTESALKKYIEEKANIESSIYRIRKNSL